VTEKGWTSSFQGKIDTMSEGGNRLERNHHFVEAIRGGRKKGERTLFFGELTRSKTGLEFPERGKEGPTRQENSGIATLWERKWGKQREGGGLIKKKRRRRGGA